MLTDRDLFAPDLPGNRNVVDPLRGETPNAVLDQILAWPRRKPNAVLLQEVREALADKLAIRASIILTEADQLILAHHVKLRAALVQAGRGKELLDAARHPLPDGLAATTLATFAQKVYFANAAEAGDELHKRSVELTKLIGLSYGDAMIECARADKRLSSAYLATDEASEPVNLASEDDDPEITRRVHGVLHRGKRSSFEGAARRIDPRDRIEGKPHLLRMGPLEDGGGMFALGEF